MSIANRLYDRPHGSNISPVNVPVLYVDGQFLNAIPSAAYRGTLNIHNAIGACRAELVSGDLPPGYTLGVDNAAHQVVLTWPAYQTGTVDIPNAGFANGDDGSWELSAGWSIMQGVTAPDPDDPGNNWQAQFADQGGESQMMHRMWADVTPGQTITASCDVQQGATSANGAGAAVRLQFKDAAGALTSVDGNVVKSGSNSEWHPSNLSTPVPPGSIKVRIGAGAYRKRQNAPLWVDNFAWNVTQVALGVDVPETIPLSLRVIDSSGRAANWTGTITVKNWDYTFVSSDAIDEAWGGICVPAIDTAHQVVLAGGHTHLFATTDGMDWTQTSSSPPITDQIRQLGCTDTAWFAVVNDSSNSSVLYVSTDQGGTWTVLYQHVPNDSTNYNFDAQQLICSGACVAACVPWNGDLGPQYSTDDGATWIDSTAPASWSPIDSVVRPHGIYIPEWELWVIAGGGGNVYTAAGAVPTAWVHSTTLTSRIGSCCYSPKLDMLVIAGQAGLWIKQGKDGAWSTNRWPSGLSGICDGLCWVDRLGIFFAPISTSYASQIALVSNDGVTWTKITFQRAGHTLAMAAAVYVPWLGQIMLQGTMDAPYVTSLSDI